MRQTWHAMYNFGYQRYGFRVLFASVHGYYDHGMSLEGRQCAARTAVWSVCSAAMALAMVCGHSLIAQTAATSPDAPASSYGDLLQFQPGIDQPYHLGRGDSVSINVEGRPELTGKQIIGPDGEVTLPMIGTISMVDKTRDQAAAAIREALLKFYTNPVVTVGVDAYTSNRILLLGSVERPGVQVFDRPPTLLEVLVRGGSVTRPAGTAGPGLLTGGGGGNGGFGGGFSSGGSGVGGGGGLPGGYGVGSSAGTLPDRCTIYRGNQTAINLDLKQLIASGSSFANLRLQRDDVVYIPANTDRYVSVLGQVFRPGSQYLQRDTTLARLIADAGGPTIQAGKNPHIRVYEAATGKEREIDFKDLLGGKGSEIPLHSGDIVYLPMSGFNSATYTFERISPLVSIFTTAALLKQ